MVRSVGRLSKFNVSDGIASSGTISTSVKVGRVMMNSVCPTVQRYLVLDIAGR